ncbi:DUF6934 family protein [Dyadobacter sp. CY261]|uniref:DUF6934 family protein n=1 Tax=Dyadobacter sp. CY261 TaxID=2907203 RepID=UPI001F160D0B|nr:hypothetical protein [Dyadobacter sp. CY261]
MPVKAQRKRRFTFVKDYFTFATHTTAQLPASIWYSQFRVSMQSEFYPFQSDDDRLYFDFFSVSYDKTITKAVVFTEFSYAKRLFNLALVDVLSDGELSDMATSGNNLDLEKVMATVSQCIRLFFEKYPDAEIQIQGNTPAKNRLYRMVITRELSNIRKYYEIYGANGPLAEPFEVGKAYKAYVLKLRTL